MRFSSFRALQKLEQQKWGVHGNWEHRTEQHDLFHEHLKRCWANKTHSFVETRSCASNWKVFRSSILACSCCDTRILNTNNSCETCLSSFGSILVPNIKLHFSCKLQKTGFCTWKRKVLKSRILRSSCLHSGLRKTGNVCDTVLSWFATFLAPNIQRHFSWNFEISLFRTKGNLSIQELIKHRFLVSAAHTGEVRALAVQNSPEMRFHQKWGFSVFELFDS